MTHRDNQELKNTKKIDNRQTDLKEKLNDKTPSATPENLKYNHDYFLNYEINDPAYAADCKEYGRAIPSRPFIAQLLTYTPNLNFDQICAAFNLTKQWQADALESRLKVMLGTQVVYLSPRETFALTDKNAVIKGHVVGHGEGYGYVMPDSGGEPIFLEVNAMQNIMHGDYISVRVTGLDYKGRRQGEFVELLTRKVDKIIGKLVLEQGAMIFVPENRRISHHFGITPEHANGAKIGQIVLIKMLTPPSKEALATGSVLEILGDEMNAGLEIKIALFNHNIPHEWPQTVLDEVAAIPDTVSEQDKLNKRDVRDLPLVTIDGITARDFDDAVFAEQVGTGFRLYVAIADVAHYVRLGTPLDDEAVNRATSVYFPNKVIPMLPEKLSNGLCSLNPDVDRLCMLCVMDIDASGAITHAEFYNAVMRSHARFTYETVAQILEGDGLLRKNYAKLVPHLDTLYALFKVLKIARDQRGSINFETRETEVEYDAEGHIESIKPSSRTEAHMVIEECMIAANVATAMFLTHYKVPALYRVHPKPPEERLNKLREFLKEFNLGLNGGLSPTSKDYADTLQAASEKEAFEMIQTVMLRSLSQAIYHPDNEGHFGLALEHYAHFTSPIRRYPDLLAHRAIKFIIARGVHMINLTNKSIQDNIQNNIQDLDISAYSYDHAKMLFLGEQCSMAERRADDAVREATDWLKCQFMKQYVGETFAGKITGVTNFGLFVELNDVFIEGLVHVSSLTDDFYKFDADKHRLIGERTGRMLRLNDPVMIRVMEANPETKKIDFQMLGLKQDARNQMGIRKKKSPSDLSISSKLAKSKASKSQALKIKSSAQSAKVSTKVKSEKSKKFKSKKR